MDTDTVTGTAEKIDSQPNRALVIFAVFAAVAVLLPLGYALYTGHVWEDFFITFRFSRNLAEGHGLVYEPGRKVHGFTSPLGVLLPALCYLAYPAGDYLSALWIFRLAFCIPSFLLGGFFLAKAFLGPLQSWREAKPASLCTMAFALLFYSIEAKAVMFTVNGMETGLMLLFCAMALCCTLESSGEEWFNAGLAWAGLMWTRPDSCFYVASFMIATLASAGRENRTRALRGIVKSALLTTALYLPWFIWTWAYYGSPVPHTVTAKGSELLSGGPAGFISRLFLHLSWIYQPVYPQFGGWQRFVPAVASCVSVFCFGYWLFAPKPSSRIANLARSGSISFFVVCIYLGLMSFPYPWYFPPIGMIGFAVLPAGVLSLFEKFNNPDKAMPYTSVICGIFAALLAFILILSSIQMRIQQQIIEHDTRMAAGKWLKRHVAPGDRVFLECLGYIGYFSEASMLDYPGLCTPEVVSLVRTRGLDMGAVIPELKPEWLVLRPHEVQAIYQEPFFIRDYNLVHEFDSQSALKEFNFIPGENYLLYDSFFYIFRRRPGIDK